MHHSLKTPIWVVALFTAFMTGMAAHSYVFDCHYFSPEEEYELTNNDPDVTYEEWLTERETRDVRFLDWFADGVACSFDPWYESKYDTPDGHDKDNDHR